MYLQGEGVDPPIPLFSLRSTCFNPIAAPSSGQIYHPNLDLDGNVCLNILREDWKPVLNLNSVMVGLQYLFLEPNADDPLNKGAFARISSEILLKSTPFICV